jgi:hypothetical protein
MKAFAVGLAVALITAGSATAAFVVTSKDIKNGTIQLVDISPKAKKALRGQRGPRGLQGIQVITEVQSPETLIPPAGGVDASPTCPDRQRPIAGGFQALGTGMPGSAATVTLSKRTARGWIVRAQNSGTAPGALIAYVYCAPNVTLLP